MDELPSAQFRKRYAKLTDQTVVTVNGHAIGLWTPAASLTKTVTVSSPEEIRMELRPGKTPQAARDDLLRRINRRG